MSLNLVLEFELTTMIFEIIRNFIIMKNSLFSCLFLLYSFSLVGQSDKPPISIAYFSQFGFQPGVKIATEFNLKALGTGSPRIKKQYLFISPQIGFFTRPNNSSNLLLNTDIGIKSQKEGKTAFTALSLGLGYLHEFQISTLAIQLGDGNQSSSRINRSYFLPTVNYAFGNHLSTTIDWYSKIGVGQRFGGGISNTTTVLFEVGLQFNIR